MYQYLARIVLAVMTFSLGVGATDALRALTKAPRQLIFVTAHDAALLSELMQIEAEWHEAQAQGDRHVMNRLLADEFTNIDPFGEETTRAQFVPLVVRGKVWNQNYELGLPEIVEMGADRVSIELDKTWSAPGYHKLHFRDIDTFIKRDGRWQVIRSDSAQYPYWLE